MRAVQLYVLHVDAHGEQPEQAYFLQLASAVRIYTETT